MKKLDLLANSRHFPLIVAIGVATLVALVLLPAIRRLVVAFTNLYYESNVSKKVLGLRQPPAQVRVRQTDLVANMKRDDRQKFRYAEAALAQGQILVAAQIFESIKFQRRAIDELEKAGLIDEACAVLVRMNVPNRAGVIYERHRAYDKAAHFYTLANQHESAAKVFLKLAESDASFLLKAASSYENAGKIDEALRLLGSQVQTERVIELAMKQKQFGALAAYAADLVTAKEIFAKIPGPLTTEFLMGLPDCPRHARLLATWLALPEVRAESRQVLEKAGKTQDCSNHFWRALDPNLAREVRASLGSLELSPTVFAQHNLAMTLATSA